MCPVTLFQSMAIADGVIDGIDCSSDIASLSDLSHPLSLSHPPRPPRKEKTPFSRYTNTWVLCLTVSVSNALLIHCRNVMLRSGTQHIDVDPN
jgi:hypothetical protein